MENKICAVTEVSDQYFHFTRVAISSFIEYNPWFDGTIYLLSHNLLPVSQKNLTSLSSIYRDIEVINVTESLNKYSDLFKHSRNAETVHSVIRYSVFDLNKKKLLYFSSHSLFLKNVSSLLIPEKISAIPNSLSMFYLDTQIDLYRDYYLEIEEGKKLFSSSQSHFETVLFSKLMESRICAVSNLTLGFSSQFKDSSFNKLRQNINSISCLVFNTFSQKVKEYSKINLIWLQKNKLTVTQANRPINFNNFTINQTKIAHALAEKSSNGDNIPPFLEKIAMFTTLNDNYIEYAIIAFESFKILNPHIPIDFYVIASNISERSKLKLQKNSIAHIELNLSDVYRIEKDWPYPSECFWLFKGPEIFNEYGYPYSIYIDADVMCNKRMDLTWLHNVNILGGAHRGASLFSFLNKIDKINKIFSVFKIVKSDIDIPSINSGVLFFNNKKYTELEIYKKSVDIFNISKLNGIPRKGDDSLLCLLMAIYSKYEYTVLSNDWNNYSFYTNKHKNHFNSVIIHNFRQKPWTSISPKYRFNKFVKAFVEKWNHIKQKMINDGRL